MVEVGQHGAEAGAAPASLRQAAGGEAGPGTGRPGPASTACAVRLEVGDEQVGQAVAVHVAEGDPHVRLRLAQGVVGDAAADRFFREGAVLLVDPEVVGVGVVGDEDIGPAVAGEIEADARPSPGPACRPGPDATVRSSKPSHFPEASQPRLRNRRITVPGKMLGLTVIALARRADARPALVDVEVIDDGEVEPAVAVVIDERGGGAPERVVDAGLLRDLAEAAAARLRNRRSPP